MLGKKWKSCLWSFRYLKTQKKSESYSLKCRGGKSLQSRFLWRGNSGLPFTSSQRICGLQDLRGFCPMSGSTTPLSLAAVSLAFLKIECAQRLQSFPSSLWACKYTLFSLSSLLSSYLLPCKVILLLPARQGACLTVTQILTTPSYFPAATF